MNISVVVIGDELLIGQVTDTNSGAIARHIAPYGWETRYVQTVGDNADDIRSAIDRAFERSRVVITTGGLGPTKDDITKGVMRDYFGGELREDPEVLANVRSIVARRGFRLNDLTAAQAIVPSSCRVIQNRVGTAPIMWFEPEGEDRVLVAMPGVPFETETMFAEEVFPQLLRRFGSDLAIEHAVLIVTGMTESALAERIAGWEDALPAHLHLAYLPKPGVIRLRIDGAGRDGAFVRSEVERASAELCAMLGDAVMATADLTPAEILLQECTRRGLRIATAESCTGGNIIRALTGIPGASAAVAGGIVAYSNDVKTGVLGVDAAAIEAHGAVSIPVVEQMARGALRATGADVALATSGIAGPSGGTAEKPVGTVCMAVALASGATVSETAHFPGSRARVVDASTTRVLIAASRLVRRGS